MLSYEEVLYDLAQAHPELLVLTAENRAAIRRLPERLGERFLDFGICEQTLVGAAAGLALRGRLPVVHALAAFLTMRAFEFIRTDVGWRRLPVILVGYVPGFLSEANGPTHQALEDVALMRGIPGMNVFCPADRDELTRGMRLLAADPVPCYVRYCDLPPSIPHAGPWARGRAELLSEGRDVTLLTYGLLLREAVEAMRILELRGVSVRLVDLRWLQPVDREAILESARLTSALVTLEDHFQTGGLYSIVCETLQRAGLSRPVLPLALEERWFQPGLLPEVLHHEGFRGDQIAVRILEELSIHAH